MKPIIFKRNTFYLINSIVILIVLISWECLMHLEGDFKGISIDTYILMHLISVYSILIIIWFFLVWKNKQICFYDEGIVYTNLLKKEKFYKWDEVKKVKYKSSGGRGGKIYYIYFSKGKIIVDYNGKEISDLERLLEEKKLIDDIQTKVLKATSKNKYL